MRRTVRTLLTIAAALLIVSQVFAASAFTIRHIRIEGLHGLSKETVLNYMPVSVGDRYDAAKSAKTLKALFASGFFTNVRLAQQGSTLIVKVVERATIASVKVNGNKAIKKEDMQKMLRNANITVGNVYNRGTVQSLKEGLHTYYYASGYYSARIDIHAQSLPRNRIALTIDIAEGKITKVKEIRFTGNHAFSNRTLLKQMTITEPKLWSFLTKGDQYSEPKLAISIQHISAYYMNRGYIHFRIISKQVSLSPDREKVYITIHIYEGAQYHFSGFTITGHTILPKAHLAHLVTFTPGEVFSKAAVIDSNKALAFALGDKGYAFARIEPMPTIDEHAHTVAINFHIIPGAMVYVRRILFQGNTVTADYVLRRSMQQMEGSLLSLREIHESVRHLRLIQFFKNIHVQTVPVPGTNNQVDLIYHVTEAPAGQAKVSFGLSSDNSTKKHHLGFSLGAGIQQPNFLGTGRTVGLAWAHSAYATSYSINYFDPYYTLNNIGRGISAFYTKTEPGDVGISGPTFDTYGFAVNYTVPLSPHAGYGFGFGLSHIKLDFTPCVAGTPGCPLSTEFTTFVAKNGMDFVQPTVNASVGYATLDRGFFPTEGTSVFLAGEASVPVSNKTLRYYKVGAAAKYFHPLNHSRSFILLLRAGTAYGAGYGHNTGLPFFLNYYAGGLSQGLVRGYMTNNLGPQDSTRAFPGGNFLVYGGVSLIFPNHISPDTLRTSLFFDVGNVYQTVKALRTISAGGLRYSVGIAAQWHSPVGPIVFSIAKPIHKRGGIAGPAGRRGDPTEPFQFSMGTSF